MIVIVAVQVIVNKLFALKNFFVTWIVYDWKIGNNSVYFSRFSNHGINFIGNLVDINGKYKSWDTIKYEYNSTNKEKFRWLQLVHAIPKLWIEALNKDQEPSVNLAIYDHNLIKNCQLYILDKLVSKELYNIWLCSMYEKPALQSYYKKITWNNQFELERNIHFTK